MLTYLCMASRITKKLPTVTFATVANLKGLDPLWIAVSTSRYNACEHEQRWELNLPNRHPKSRVPVCTGRHKMKRTS